MHSVFSMKVNKKQPCLEISSFFTLDAVRPSYYELMCFYKISIFKLQFFTEGNGDDR